jgi:exodeoxyribonuclease VII small subunit
MTDTTEPSGYADALAELDTILADLERADVDVDILAEQVKRASVLITFCRERITNARFEIDQVVATLDDTP